jgi:hypothetical protein
VLTRLLSIFTILVLLVSAGEANRKRIGAPAALMQPYVKQEG